MEGFGRETRRTCGLAIVFSRMVAADSAADLFGGAHGSGIVDVDLVLALARARDHRVLFGGERLDDFRADGAGNRAS